LLVEAGTLIRERLGVRRCVIVTDSNVGPLYLARLEAVLASAGHTVLVSLSLPAGEGSKDFDHLRQCLEAMLAAGLDRQTLVVALGGGVVGDLAGLAASLAMRGVSVVQIPTSLLAQVDSSVGGKTAIDTPFGKNTVGSFFQPALVLADVAVLDSLPARELRAGYAEVVKYGLIGDEAFFRWCQTHGGKLLNGDHEAQMHAVAASCAAKAAIVAADERESGARALLNFGHTFGHALETALGYGHALIHGEAVAIGMVMATRLSHSLGLCTIGDVTETREHLRELGLPVAPPRHDYDLERLMALMAQDKKAEAGRLTLILTRGIGRAFVSRDVDPDAVRAVWKEFLPS
jgi:3-dehydroquinate synthase